MRSIAPIAPIAACAAVLLACGPGRIPPGSPATEAGGTAEVMAAPPPAGALPEVDFARDVAPILERCRPCHFEGGKMYDKLPFDRADTIRKLGTALFTRIKDEREQAIINAFLSREATGTPATPPTVP